MNLPPNLQEAINPRISKLLKMSFIIIEDVLQTKMGLAEPMDLIVFIIAFMIAAYILV